MLLPSWRFFLVSTPSPFLQPQAAVVQGYEKTNLTERKHEVVKQLMQQIDDWKASLPESSSGNVFSNERSQPAADR